MTCCHSMSSLCDISITKRKLCLIMQVEMAKKTQGCISYGFLSAKQGKTVLLAVIIKVDILKLHCLLYVPETHFPLV